jgi:TolB-like protein
MATAARNLHGRHRGIVVRLFQELRRRRVLPIAGAYIAIAWLAVEVAGFLLEQLAAPAWALRLLAIALVVGFPVAVALAWMVQRQPGGGWRLDSSRGQFRAALVTIALGVLATAGLAWLILPRIEDAPTAGDRDYQPIPNSIALLPLAGSVGTPGERATAETFLAALGTGLDQADDLIVLDLRKLDERPRDPLEFGRSIKAAALLTGTVLQVTGGTRIQLELIDVGQRALTWSHAFDWEPTRVADTGLGIANDVLGAMAMPALSRDVFTGTDNPDAYHAFLLGGQHAASLNITDLATGGRVEGAGRPRQAGAGDGPRARP